MSLKNCNWKINKGVDEIEYIIQLIKDIADQINLFSFKSTIEMAHVGEHKKEFAVIIEEIRKLADRTLKATDEIAKNKHYPDWFR